MNKILPLKKLKNYIESEHYRGYDPYDALNSPILKAFSFNLKYVQIAFTQILKSLPIDIRFFLSIKKGYNPKGIGLFIWGYAKLYAIEKKSECLDRIDYLLDALERLQSCTAKQP